MIENETRKLQLTELQILKDVADFCEENDIVYFLYGGTMIGAVEAFQKIAVEVFCPKL